MENLIKALNEIERRYPKAKVIEIYKTGLTQATTPRGKEIQETYTVIIEITLNICNAEIIILTQNNTLYDIDICYILENGKIKR